MEFRKLSRIAREVVGSVLAELPAPVCDQVDEAGIFLERRPSQQDIVDGLSGDLLGYFDSGPEWSPRIRLFLINLWDYSGGDPSAYREEVRITLLHEIGHLLGWDEDEIAERGLE